MTSRTIQPLQKPLIAEVTLPGSLSYTIRALALAAMTKGTVMIENALKSNDTAAMFRALQTLGIDSEETANGFIIHGNIEDVQDKEYMVDIQLSGRSARMLLAMLCIMPGKKTLTCGDGFKKRPMGDLVDGLRQMGAQIEYLGEERCLPVRVTSNKLNAGNVHMNGHLSSQYFSAIMMIAPLIGEVTIDVIGEQSSKPFIDITIDTMEQFGVTVANTSYKSYRVEAYQTYQAKSFPVEPDATAASYFWGIAAVTGSTITVKHVTRTSKQGDVACIDVLEQMGCTVTAHDDGITVKGNEKLQGIDIDMNAIPDVVPTIAVIAAFANGTTRITGLQHLKGKESDRIEAPKTELLKMGIDAQSTEDSLTIIGGEPRGAEIQTYGDHRIAMAFAVAGTKIKGVTILNPEVVGKSFPTFWEELAKLGVQTKEDK